MMVYAIYYYTNEKLFGERIFTREAVTTSLFTAQMMVADLVAEGKEAWFEEI